MFVTIGLVALGLVCLVYLESHHIYTGMQWRVLQAITAVCFTYAYLEVLLFLNPEADRRLAVLFAGAMALITNYLVTTLLNRLYDHDGKEA